MGETPEDGNPRIMQHELKSVVDHFHIRGRLTEIVPLARGHINDTYVLAAEDNKQPIRYILQRINHNVFKDPPSLMENVVRVTEHIRSKMAGIDPEQEARQLTVIDSDSGAGFHQDAKGNFWRVYNFIEGAVTYDTVQSGELAYEAARMFGWFLRMLTDLPGPALHATIADFHNTPKRFETFEQVVKVDRCNRAKNAKAEIDFVLGNPGLCDVLQHLREEGEIPLRTTHNDTKVNNVMLDTRTNKGVCVIDLDTVMPGLSVYDFGDMVRTAATFADEDERDPSKVTIDMPMFEVLAEGFAEQTRRFLTAVETKHLVFGAKLITFEQCIRFLTDYLAGDIYYKVNRQGQNLDRTRTQMKLVQSITEHEEAMDDLVETIFQRE